jgi:hypothetical protein
MYLTQENKLIRQRSTLPAGFDLLTEGKLQEGDIRWNCIDDCWNLNDITVSPKHDIVIGDPICNFHGVCRQRKLIRETTIVENPLHKPQYINL